MQFFVGEGFFPHGHATKRLGYKATPEHTQTQLGQARNLEVEYIPAASQLLTILLQGFLKRSRMGTIQDNKSFSQVGIVGGKRPGHTTTPVMPDNDGPFCMKGMYQTPDIPGEPVNMIIGYAARLIALVVAAHVRCHDGEMFRQGRDLISPRIPKFGEPVQQNEQWTGTLRDVM
jgi:hypothetical protein